MRAVEKTKTTLGFRGLTTIIELRVVYQRVDNWPKPTAWNIRRLEKQKISVAAQGYALTDNSLGYDPAEIFLNKQPATELHASELLSRFLLVR